MPDTRDRRIVQSENAIIEAGIEVFLTNPSAGMSEIAATSGVGRTTLYRHFDSRESLLQAIALHCYDELDIVLKPLDDMAGREAIEATFALIIPVANNYRFLNSLWQEISEDPIIRQRSRRSSEDIEFLINQAKQRKEIDSSLPSNWLVTFYEMTLYAAWSLLESGELSVEQAADYATRSFFGGCAAKN